MKFIEPRPCADPDTAARKLIEIANGVEVVMDGRIYIERVNEPFLPAGGVSMPDRVSVKFQRADGGLAHRNWMSALLQNRRNCRAATK
jgi:hypothetical protein